MRNLTKRILSLFMITIISISCLLTVSASDNSYYRYQGNSNLYLLSMISSGDIDSALETGGDILYIPAGTYVIKKPIMIDSGEIIGAGMDKTIIVADFENPNQPIVMAGGNTVIKDIQFRYKDGLVTGKEEKDQRVGLFAGNYWSLQKGAVLSNVKFANVGTAIRSKNTVATSDLGVADKFDKQSLSATCFSVTFDNIVIEDFSYRGIDFAATTRTGNVWRNMYLSSGKYACNSAFWFEGEESECNIENLTVADTRAERPIYINSARALDAGSISLRNIELIDDNLIYIYFEKSAGYIKHLSLNATTVESVQTLVQIGETEFVGSGYDVLNRLHIGKLSLSNVKGMKLATGFNFFKRKSGFTTPFYITVEGYYYDAQQLEKETYRSFPTSEENLIYTKKGQILEKGSTIMRPSQRLCPYYTRYEDTDLGKTLIWNGEEWK